MLKLYHLNCGTLAPLSARMMNGTGGLFQRGRLVCHCLLIESDCGLILVDTGIGTQDLAIPKQFGTMFNFLSHPHYEPEETAIAQIQRLGFQAEDVKHIIMTHLDLDHAGGLADFPHASVHVHANEYRAAMERKSLADQQRYLPRQWAHDVQWKTYSREGEQWFGLRAIRALEGLPKQIALIPLFGHSPGHCGVAIQQGKQWLLHCGDAYFHRNQLHEDAALPLGVSIFENSVQWSRSLRLQTLERLQILTQHHPDKLTLFCYHDPIEFQQRTTIIEEQPIASNTEKFA